MNYEEAIQENAELKRKLHDLEQEKDNITRAAHATMSPKPLHVRIHEMQRALTMVRTAFNTDLKPFESSPWAQAVKRSLIG